MAASKHTHACAQCSHTSVGLTQAHPNQGPCNEYVGTTLISVIFLCQNCRYYFNGSCASSRCHFMVGNSSTVASQNMAGVESCHHHKHAIYGYCVVNTVNSIGSSSVFRRTGVLRIAIDACGSNTWVRACCPLQSVLPKRYYN